MGKIGALFLFVFLISLQGTAQQMVVVKKGRIISRFNLGDDIRFVLKGDKQVHHTAILSIHEFEFITIQKDTIQFSQVAKLKFRNKGVWNYVKSSLVGSAGLMALHFALKGPYGDKNPQAVKGLAYAAGGGLVSVLMVIVTSRTSIKLAGFKRLKFINYDSPLYR